MTSATPAPGAPGARTRLGPFRHASYSAYWAGGLVSNLGTWLQAVAGSIYVYQLSGSTFAVGVFNFAGFVPVLLFSVWGGNLSDRRDRRTIVTVTHAASAAIGTVLAALTLAGLATELHLIVATFILNVLWAVGKPSLVALIPNIVPREDVHDAVGLNALQFNVGQIIGPVLAAVIMATSGAGLAFSVNAFTYLAPVAVMAFLVRRGVGGPAPAPDARGSAPRPAFSTGGFVREHLWVPALLAGVVATAAPMEIQRTIAPELVHEVLGEPESSAGLLVAAQSLGSVAGLLAFVGIRRRGWSRRAAFAGYLVQASGLVVAAGASTLLVAAAGVALIGLGFSLSFPVLTSTLQSETPDGHRGRVMALHQMAHLGNRPFTAIAVGTVAVLAGPQAGLLAGLVFAPAGLAAVRRAWRDLPGDPDRAAASAPGATRAGGAARGADGDDRDPVLPG